MMYDAGYGCSIPLEKELRCYAKRFLHCPLLQYGTCRPAQVTIISAPTATFGSLVVFMA